MPLLLAAVGLLAHARLTRLVAADRVTLPLRAALVRRLGPSHALSYLVHCRWCAGMWLALPVAAATTWAAGLPHPLPVTALLALAYSHTTGLLARAEGDE